MINRRRIGFHWSFGLCHFFLQFVALLWQVITTRSTARKELRAYVIPTSASRYQENGIARLKLVLTNSGKTPAANCIGKGFEGIAAVVKPLPPIPAIKSEVMRSVSFIAPDNEIRIHEEPLNISPLEAQAIRKATRAIYVIGTVTYTDVFKGIHKTNYRFMCSGENFNAGFFVFCDEGNQID